MSNNPRVKSEEGFLSYQQEMALPMANILQAKHLLSKVRDYLKSPKIHDKGERISIGFYHIQRSIVSD